MQTSNMYQSKTIYNLWTILSSKIFAETWKLVSESCNVLSFCVTLISIFCQFQTEQILPSELLGSSFRFQCRYLIPRRYARIGLAWKLFSFIYFCCQMHDQTLQVVNYKMSKLFPNVSLTHMCTNGFFLLVLYNTLGMVHCIYWGVTGYNSKKYYIQVSEYSLCLSIMWHFI